MKDWFWWLVTTPPNKQFLEIPFFVELIDRSESAVFSWVAVQVMYVTQVFSSLLLSTPSEFILSQEFRDLYLFMNMVSLGMMLPIIGWSGLKNIMGRAEVEETVSLIYSLLYVPLYSAIAPAVLFLVINVGNNMAQLLLTVFLDVPVHEGLLPKTFQVGLFIFLVVYLVLLVRLIMFYCYRNYALLVLLVIAPVGFVFWSLPTQSKKMEKWAQEILSLIVVQVMHAVQLAILVTLTMGVNSITKNSSDVLFIQIGAMLFMISTPEWLKEYFYDYGSEPKFTGSGMRVVNKIVGGPVGYVKDKIFRK